MGRNIYGLFDICGQSSQSVPPPLPACPPVSPVGVMLKMKGGRSAVAHCRDEKLKRMQTGCLWLLQPSTTYEDPHSLEQSAGSQAAPSTTPVASPRYVNHKLFMGIFARHDGRVGDAASGDAEESVYGQLLTWPCSICSLTASSVSIMFDSMVALCLGQEILADIVSPVVRHP